MAVHSRGVLVALSYNNWMPPWPPQPWKIKATNGATTVTNFVVASVMFLLRLVNFFLHPFTMELRPITAGTMIFVATIVDFCYDRQQKSYNERTVLLQPLLCYKWGDVLMQTFFDFAITDRFFCYINHAEAETGDGGEMVLLQLSFDFATIDIFVATSTMRRRGGTASMACAGSIRGERGHHTCIHGARLCPAATARGCPREMPSSRNRGCPREMPFSRNRSCPREMPFSRNRGCPESENGAEASFAGERRQ